MPCSARASRICPACMACFKHSWTTASSLAVGTAGPISLTDLLAARELRRDALEGPAAVSLGLSLVLGNGFLPKLSGYAWREKPKNEVFRFGIIGTSCRAFIGRCAVLVEKLYSIMCQAAGPRQPSVARRPTAKASF